MSDDFEITIPKSKPAPREYALKIDSRENAIVNWYKQSELVADNRITVERMDTTDFMFLRDNIPFVCIERKRIDDFASSIRDGRYKTQKLEMIEMSNKYETPPFLVYLVEQFSIESDEDMSTIIGKTNISKETVLSAITKTMFRDGFQIVFTKDLQDSIRWLTKMWTNLCNNQFEGYDMDDSYSEYYQNVSRKLAKRTTSQMKSIDRDKTNSWWMLALTNINGISVSKAQEIIKKYPDVRSLLKAYDKCKTRSEKEKLLSNLRVNTRRIGDAASKTVFEHITNDTASTKPKPKPKPKKTEPPKEKVDFSVCLIDSDSEGW
jgi:ERCC4-type nuclease